MTNAGWGGGEWLVAEADESDRSFLELSPEIAVVTNVELDHHTTYGSRSSWRTRSARSSPDYRPRAARSSGTAAPHGRSRQTAARSHSMSPTLTTARRRSVPRPTSSPATCGSPGSTRSSSSCGTAGPQAQVELSVPGRHNVLNALAAIAACTAAGCDARDRRRMRSLHSARPHAASSRSGERHGVRVFDDYAHHPTEVRATLEAARALEPTRLIAVFQPHLYSRTLHLHRSSGASWLRPTSSSCWTSMRRASGRRVSWRGVSGKLVADACADHAGGRPVWWLPTLEEAEAMLAGSWPRATLS